MKNTLLMVAVALLATPAMASKARVTALGSARHLSDAQYVYSTRVTDVHNVGELVQVEFGTAGSTPDAEGVLVKKSGDAVWGLGLGHNGTLSSQVALVNSAAAAGGEGLTAGGADQVLKAEQNPFYLVYGRDAGNMKWAAGLNYSSSDLKGSNDDSDGTLDPNKTSSMSLNVGAETDKWDAMLALGLGSKATSTDDGGTERTLTGTTGLGLSGGYKQDSMYWYASYSMTGAKFESAGAEVSKYETNQMSAGVINSHKKGEAEVFYGIAYESSTTKRKPSSGAAENNISTTALPIIVGVEADATSWLTLRGSIKQGVLIGSSKTVIAGVGDTNSNADDTTIAAGVGLKWGKAIIDATLAGVASGNLGTDAGGTNNRALANASLTYNF